MPHVSFHIPKAWMEALKKLAGENGGMSKLVVKALEELIARYKQAVPVTYSRQSRHETRERLSHPLAVPPKDLTQFFSQLEFVQGRPPTDRKPVSEPDRRPKRRRTVTAVKQKCNRCCQLVAEAEKWFRHYLQHLIERARGAKGAVFSVVVTRDVRRLFNVYACPHLASYISQRLHETGCVKEVLVKSGKSAKKQARRLVLDKQCVLALEARHL